jgi:hypothetical protein
VNGASSEIALNPTCTAIVWHVAIAAEDHGILPLAQLRVAGLGEGDRGALNTTHP